MGEYIGGDAFLYSITGIDFSKEDNRFLKLDEICREQGWEQLGNTWNSLSFSESTELLMDSIEFDIAYSSARITPHEIALKFHQTLLKEFKENNTYCYSNWFNNHWRVNEKGSSWNSLTESTFDLSAVFINTEEILITYFRSEE